MLYVKKNLIRPPRSTGHMSHDFIVKCLNGLRCGYGFFFWDKKNKKHVFLAFNEMWCVL